MALTEFQQFIREKVTIRPKFNLSWIIYRYTKLAIFGFFSLDFVRALEILKLGPKRASVIFPKSVQVLSVPGVILV